MAASVHQKCWLSLSLAKDWLLSASVSQKGWLGFGPSQRLAALVRLAGPLEFQKLAARFVFGCKPHYQTTTLCAALMARLEVVARQWSERHKAYQETEKVIVPGWRMATVKEVEERREDLLHALKATTTNVYRISKTQGLAVPLCKLQDGVILPKNSFTVMEDIETPMTGKDQFKTFVNLYSLRFTRYVDIIKERY